MLEIFGKVRRAQLYRTLNLACGCVITLPMMDSQASLLDRALAVFDGPRYQIKCNNDPRHRSLAEVIGSG